MIIQLFLCVFKVYKYTCVFLSTDPFWKARYMQASESLIHLVASLQASALYLLSPLTLRLLCMTASHANLGLSLETLPIAFIYTLLFTQLSLSILSMYPNHLSLRLRITSLILSIHNLALLRAR